MCSSGGSVATEDKALQAAQTAQVNTLNADYSTSFAEQQQVLKAQQARLQYMASNPMGYTPAQLATAKTSINENTSNAAKQALGSAAAFAAAHGASDIGGGATGEIAGAIGSGAAQSKAQQLSSLSQQNEAIKQQNMWQAISGLNQVGAEYGGAGTTAAGASSSTADSGVNAGSGALAAQQAGWQDVAGVLGGISGLAQAAVTPWAGTAKGCWIAAAIYGGWNEPRTVLVRNYIFGEFSTTWYGYGLSKVYEKIGERVSNVPLLVRLLTPLFNVALRKAQEK